MSSVRKEEATSPAMSAPRRWPRLLQMSVGLVVIIILACVFCRKLLIGLVHGPVCQVMSATAC